MPESKSDAEHQHELEKMRSRTAIYTAVIAGTLSIVGTLVATNPFDGDCPPIPKIEVRVPVIYLGYAGTSQYADEYDFRERSGNLEALEKRGRNKCTNVGGSVEDYKLVGDTGEHKYAALICMVKK